MKIQYLVNILSLLACKADEIRTGDCKYKLVTAAVMSREASSGMNILW